MKKMLSLVLKLTLAAAGIGYIVWTLTWSDQIAVPAGYTYPDGQVAGAKEVLIVQAKDPGGAEGALLTHRPGDETVISIRRSELGVTAKDLRFKPGIVTTMCGADVSLLLVGLLLILPVFPVQAFRWWLLMRCRGMDVPFARAMRLTMVGLFFNFCMPGMTGGDVVKAYYAAKGSGARGVAVMSVIFDRVAGLLGLILLAGIAGAVMLYRGGLDGDTLRLVQIVTALIWLGFVGAVVGPLIYFSRRVRRGLGLDRLIGRLGPGHILVRIDDAALAYRDHKRVILACVLVSLPVHFCQALAAALAGRALGMGLDLGLMLTVLPVIFLAGSVPLTYQGLGVMEALAVAMLLTPGLATANQLVSMLVLIRLYLIAYALVGAVMMLRGDIHLFPQIDDQDAEPKFA